MMPEHDWPTFLVYALNAANRVEFPIELLNKHELKACWLGGMTAGQAVTQQYQRELNVYPKEYKLN